MGRYTAAFVEREYNNRANVADHPAWIARWTAHSAPVRAADNARLDLRYGANPKETLDLFVPKGRARGVLVFLHGGYWRAFDKADHAFVAPAFVAGDLAVVVPNYDLCPAVGIADIVDECRRALAWVTREGAAHGIDTGNVVVCGHSAGGHLAAMLHATDWKAAGLPVPALRGSVSVSGLHDLQPLIASSYNADLHLDEAEARRLSPVHLAPTSASPVVAVVGARESSEYLRQARALFDAWPAQRPPDARGPMVIPGRHHFDVVADYEDPSSALTRATLDLFA